MEDEIIPLNFPGRSGKRLAILSGIVACILMAGVGVSAAAVRYDARNRQVVLHGVTIGGMSMGGMPFSTAKFRLIERFDVPLERGMTVEAGSETFAIAPSQLGARTDALEHLTKLTSIHHGLGLWERIWLRLSGGSLDKEFEVKMTLDAKRVEGFLGEVNSKAERPALDVTFEFVDGSLLIKDGVPGFSLDMKAAESKLEEAIASGATHVRLPGVTTLPAQSRATVDDVLVIVVGENKLHHFRGEELLKTYDVATGLPRYPTPMGQFKVVNKRKNPSWSNPAKYPGGWGWSLPARIGPGPTNPLGTRALDLSASGIRIHGTSATYSIGYNASHGCIRMRRADVEELFDRVDIDAPVLIVRSGSYRFMPSRPPPAQPEPTAETDATEIPGQTESPPPPPQETTPIPKNPAA